MFFPLFFEVFSHSTVPIATNGDQYVSLKFCPNHLQQCPLSRHFAIVVLDLRSLATNRFLESNFCRYKWKNLPLFYVRFYAFLYYFVYSIQYISIAVKSVGSSVSVNSPDSTRDRWHQLHVSSFFSLPPLKGKLRMYYVNSFFSQRWFFSFLNLTQTNHIFSSSVSKI